MQALSDESLLHNKKSYFDQICQMAKDKNDTWFATKNGLDVRQGLYTPASKLAEEGDKDSVLFLIKYGANIHEAAMGAVMGKHYVLAEILRTRYGANVNFIAKGVCMAKDTSREGVRYLDYLIKYHHAEQPLIAMGAALTGDFIHAEKLLAAFRSVIKIPEHEQDKIQGFVSGIIQGALIYGDWDYAQQLIQKYNLNIESVMKFLTSSVDITFIEILTPNNGRWLAWFAAFAGNETYCQQLMEDQRWNHDERYRQDVIEGIIIGAFLGGHIQIIQNFNFFGNCIPELQLDNFHKVSCLATHIRGILERDKHCIQFAAGIGCLETAITVYKGVDEDCIDKKRKILQLIEDGLTQSFFYANTTITLHQLSFVNDHAFLNILKSRKSLPTCVINIIPMAIKINQMMKKYDIDYDQAKAFLTCHLLRTTFLSNPFVLPDEVILVLSGWSSLSLESTKELYDKVSLYFNQSFLAIDIGKYKGKRWISHRSRAESLLQASEQTNNREGFNSLIQFQYRLFNGSNNQVADSAAPCHEQALTNISKGDYYQIIEKHVLRLGT